MNRNEMIKIGGFVSLLLVLTYQHILCSTFLHCVTGHLSLVLNLGKLFSQDVLLF